MDWLLATPIAHRGLHKGFKIPENSYTAFEKAISKNYAIELDVRITKDKKVVVFHDKNLIRVCGVKKKIANQNYDNIKNITLYNSKEKIPLFSDILKLIDGRVPLFVEIKNYSDVGEFEELVFNELKDYKGNYAICSFNEEVVKWFKDNKPEVKRGLIYGDLHKFKIRYHNLVFIKKVLSCKPDFISLDYKLLDTLLPKITRVFNKPLVCWTVNKKKKLAKSLIVSDNIIFENVNPFKKIEKALS